MAKLRLTRLVRYFGDTPLKKIDEGAWGGYVHWRLAQRPGSKLFDDRKYMRQVVLEAHRLGAIQVPPRLAIPDIPGTIGREITKPEIKRLLKNASSPLRFQIEIGYLMGLRLREMLRLRWDRIDWKRKTIRLLPSDTKTRRGREIPIHPRLLRRFKACYRKRKSDYVFPSPLGPWRPCNDNRHAWERCKRKAGVKARWHDLRHTCATRLLRAGHSLRIVRKILGNGERVLAEIYDHPDLSDLRAVVNTPY